jgi:hypothetical protein
MRFSNRWVPGQIGTGWRSMVSWSWVAATKVIHTGKAMTMTPKVTTRWLRKVTKGRFSTISSAPGVR